MRGDLSQRLEMIGRDLERGILDAERELADARELCRSLETEVRALRAGLRPLAPELTALLSMSDRPHVDHTPPSMGAASVEETPVADHPGLVLPLSSVETSQPPTGAAPAAAHPGDDDISTDYIPMLEELRGIARRDGSR